MVFKEKVGKEVQPTGNVVEKSKYESGFTISVGRCSLTNSTNASPLNLQFSPDSAYIAVVSIDYPTCVWIFNLSDLMIVAVLQQTSPVRFLTWHDTSPILTVITNDANALFVWQPSGCLCIPQPAVLDARHLAWMARRDTLLISGNSSFSLAVPDWATY